MALRKARYIMTKITIIGSGSVGSTIAYTLTVSGLASEIVMIDINDAKASGEAMDIRQGVPFCHPCSIYAGDYSDAAGSASVSASTRTSQMTSPSSARMHIRPFSSMVHWTGISS